MNFPGAGGVPGAGAGAGGAGAGIPGLTGASAEYNAPAAAYNPNDPMVKMLANAMESCVGKTVLSGGAGFGLGAVFGMFMASMAYDTPYHTAGAGIPGAPGNASPVKNLSDLPLKKQLAIGFKDMGQRSYSTAKNFAAVGALYAGIECGIEGLRAKNDLGNGVAAGCLTGGILARGGGPQAAAVGCAGFAAFSAAIDAWMRMPKEED
ncbi:mitochondrial import inner membrane translocase [Podospora australis]|uniref:Mitochondrial import inner membrane translocase subunit TIM22 n=1 Tax=Podospora australis TaxID=1536484 RepID=A0AAN6WNE5_9PEZI|nr:mitochondrial import inner membrane translocase [Podospora australis]